MGFVKKAVGGVADTLLGSGSQKTKTAADIAPESAEERALRERIQADLNQLIAQQQGQAESLEQRAEQTELTDKDLAIQDLFRDAVKQAIVGQNPEQMAEAEAFVDATFTRQAERRAEQTLQQLSDRQAQQQAALGRTGADLDVQRDFAQQAFQQGQDIALERGARIAQDPLRRAQAGLTGLQGIGTIQQQQAFTPQFLSDLNQRAITNRLNLLNQQGAGLDRFQGERLAGAGTTVTQPGKDTGILGGLTEITGGVRDFGRTLGGLGGGLF